MKKRIRLNESSLRRIVKESVCKVLKEYYEPDDYFDNYDLGFVGDEVLDIVDRIESGYYDRVLDKIMNDPFGYEDDAAERIIDAAHDRKTLIDKDYAFNSLPNTYRDGIEDRDYREQYGDKTNRNRFDYPHRHREALDDVYWRDKEAKEANSKYPEIVNKKGTFRSRKGKDFIDNINKLAFGTDQADKRPLHRKDSLNRAFDK